MFSSEKLNDWLQVLGLFGVMASLVFVGIQVKQAQEIAIAETYQSRTSASIDMQMNVSSNPYLLSAYSKLYAGRAQDLTSQEAIALEYSNASLLMIYENHHFQYEAGFLPEEHWQRNLDEMVCWFSHPVIRNLGEGWHFRASFQAILEDVMVRAESNPQNCWSFEWNYPIEE